MIKLRKHTLALCVLLLVNTLGFTSAIEQNSMQTITRMCEAPSSLPKEELSMHIGGGFFSVYEARHGCIYALDSTALPKGVGDAFLYKEQHEPIGELVMVVQRLRSDSPYVYAIDGFVKVSVDGTEQIFSMDRIDYVYDSKDEHLYYRLTCTPLSGCDNSICQVYLLCYNCGQNQPVLVGSVWYISQEGALEASYLFFITGRNELDAERHLEKKIAMATTY